MRKIKLSMEGLRVESFAIAAAEPAEGTILGNAKTLDTCPIPCGSAIDACASSPHSATLPCNGCMETDFC
jgi:hypothetical protein